MFVWAFFIQRSVLSDNLLHQDCVGVFWPEYMSKFKFVFKKIYISVAKSGMTTPKYKPPEKSIKKQTSNAFLFTHSKKLINRTCTIFSFQIVSKCGEQKKKKPHIL